MNGVSLSLNQKTFIEQSLGTTLDDYYNEQKNPYSGLLSLIQKNPGKNIAIGILRHFQDWIQPTRTHYQFCLTREIKLQAFKFFCAYTDINICSLATEIFGLKSKFKATFIEDLEILLEETYFEQVSAWVNILDMEEHFKVEDFLIPLLLNGKDVSEILEKTPTYKIQLASFLDKILASESILHKFIRGKNLNYSVYALDNLINKKYLRKFMRKLVDDYSFTPALKYDDDRICFLFLFNEYEKGRLSKQGFYQRIEGICKHRIIQPFVLTFIQKSMTTEDYMFWEKKVANINGLGPEPKRPAFSKGQDNFKRYHQLDKEIIFVSSETSVRDFLSQDYLSKMFIVGIDTESTSSTGFQNPVALIQIATKKKVFLIDAFSLSHKIELWNYLKLAVFHNSSVIKLGYDLSADNLVFSRFPPLSDVVFHGEDYVDLFVLSRQIEGVISYPYDEYHCDENLQFSGLSRLVKRCLGRCLLKTEQLSDWEARPLRHAQMEYAALDAACLLEVFEALAHTSWIQGWMKIIFHCPQIKHHLSSEMISSSIIEYQLRHLARSKMYQFMDVSLSTIDNLLTFCESAYNLKSSLQDHSHEILSSNTYTMTYIPGEKLRFILSRISRINNCTDCTDKSKKTDVTVALGDIYDKFCEIERTVFLNIELYMYRPCLRSLERCSYCYLSEHEDIFCYTLRSEFQTVKREISSVYNKHHKSVNCSKNPLFSLVKYFLYIIPLLYLSYYIYKQNFWRYETVAENKCNILDAITEKLYDLLGKHL